MRKKVSALVVVIFVLFHSTLYARETMKITYFKDYPPFSWKEDGLMRGILIDVLNEIIGTELGIPLSHSGYPWKRAQQMVKEGIADAFVTVPTTERRAYTEISSESVIITVVTMFTKKEHKRMEEFNKIKAVSDLKAEYKLLDYIGDRWAEKLSAYNLNLDLSPTLESVFSKLAKGRGDLFIQNSHVSNYNIKKLGLDDQIVEIPNALDSSPFHLCIGKKASFVKIIPDFDDKIRKSRESGRLQEIYDRYR